MIASISRSLLVLASLGTLTTVAHASSARHASSDKPAEKAAVTTQADPCRRSSSQTTPTAHWSPRIRRHAAIYMVQHMREACRIIVTSQTATTPSNDSDPKWTAILDDINTTVLGPIYRRYPDLANTVLPELHPHSVATSSQRTKITARKGFRAKPRDIRRSTATRFSDDLFRIERSIYKTGADDAARMPSKETAVTALLPSMDAAAELSFAAHVAESAYPDLFSKHLKTIPPQPRTDESDAAMRKAAPPRGSVKLSPAALAFIKSFMSGIRHIVPKSDQIAAIGWTLSQSKKDPDDATLVELGPGWFLGAYERAQVPPEIIDNVDGVDIVFSTEDPSSLVGKTFDIKDKKLFLRD